MRDIRNDLRERLAAARECLIAETTSYQEAAERLAEDHAKKRDSLDREIDAIRTMIAAEDTRLGGEATVLPPKLRLPLGDFLVETVKAHGMMAKNDLRTKAAEAGYLEEANGRTLHFTLLNIVKAGRLRAWADNMFDLPQHGPQFVTEEGGAPMTKQ